MIILENGQTEKTLKLVLEDLADKVYSHEGVWHPDSANEFYEMVLTALLPYRKGSKSHGTKTQILSKEDIKELLGD